MSDPKFAIYVLVVEDTNRMFNAISELGASNVESIMDIDSEEAAIDVAQEMYATGQRLLP